MAKYEYQIKRKGTEHWTAGEVLRDALQRLEDKLRPYPNSYRIRCRGESDWSRYRPLHATISRVKEIMKGPRGDDTTVFVGLDAGSGLDTVFAIRRVEFDVPEPPSGTITEAIRKLWIAAHEEFPNIGSVGIYNCRRIANSTSWSQHCLGGDTLIQTWDGLMPIADLSGTKARLLTRHPFSPHTEGVWVNSPVRSFGEDNTHTIRMALWGDEKIVKATAQHRWFVYRGERGKQTIHEVTTSQLRTGDRLISVVPRHMGRILPSPIGIMAGLVFGDGHLESSNRGGATIRLWGDDRDFLRYFPQDCPTSPKSLDTGIQGIEVRSLPRSFKAYPSLNESSSYLAGWLAGYFAADGGVNGSTVVLTSVNRDHLLFAQLVAARLGIATRKPHSSKMEGYAGIGSNRLMRQMQFVQQTIPDWMLLHAKHREKLRSVVQPHRIGCWGVVDIEPSGREEVFCPTVPGTGAFALDDWLLTGNSWGNAWDAAGPLTLLKDYQRWIEGRRDQFNVHYIAGVEQHTGHVHVDCDPYRSPPPPCAA